MQPMDDRAGLLPVRGFQTGLVAVVFLRKAAASPASSGAGRGLFLPHALVTTVARLEP